MGAIKWVVLTSGLATAALLGLAMSSVAVGCGVALLASTGFQVAASWE